MFRIKNNKLKREYPFQSFGGLAAKTYDPTKPHYSARLCEIKYTWGRYRSRSATLSADSSGLAVVDVTLAIDSINAVECGGFVYSEGQGETLQAGEYRYDRQSKLLYVKVW